MPKALFPKYFLFKPSRKKALFSILPSGNVSEIIDSKKEEKILVKVEDDAQLDCLMKGLFNVNAHNKQSLLKKLNENCQSIAVQLKLPVAKLRSLQMTEVQDLFARSHASKSVSTTQMFNLFGAAQSAQQYEETFWTPVDTLGNLEKQIACRMKQEDEAFLNDLENFRREGMDLLGRESSFPSMTDFGAVSAYYINSEDCQKESLLLPEEMTSREYQLGVGILDHVEGDDTREQDQIIERFFA